jgi:hypothetical protein
MVPHQIIMNNREENRNNVDDWDQEYYDMNTVNTDDDDTLGSDSAVSSITFSEKGQQGYSDDQSGQTEDSIVVGAGNKVFARLARHNRLANINGMAMIYIDITVAGYPYIVPCLHSCIMTYFAELFL